MAVKVGLSGMGEVGRYLLRAHQEQINLHRLFNEGTLEWLITEEQRIGLLGILNQQGADREPVEIVAVNSRSAPDKWAHLLLNGSIYGRFPGYFGFPGSVGVDRGNIVVNGRTIKTYVKDNPAKIPWNETGVDVVIDATGAFSDEPGIEGHLKSRVKNVIITEPSKYADITLVAGVNDGSYAGQSIISSGSCTTNALAPLAKALLDKYGVFTGIMTTIHAYTGSQSPTDSTDMDHPELGYAIDDNFIPTKTGAAVAIGLVLPELEGRLTGLAVRGPVSTGSLVDLTVDLGEKYTAEEVNYVLKAAADGPLKGTLGFTPEMMVSSMIKGSPIPSMVAGKYTICIGGQAKILAFYDNIAGFAYQVLKLAQLVGQYASPTTPRSP